MPNNQQKYKCFWPLFLVSFKLLFLLFYQPTDRTVWPKWDTMYLIALLVQTNVLGKNEWDF